MELLSDKVNLLRNNLLQFLYCSAEAALEKPFLAVLREDSELHRAVSAILVDESHTVDASTGKWQDSIFAFAAILPWGGGGTPLSGLYRYLLPQKVWFLAVLVINSVSILTDFGHFGHK